MSLMNKKLSEFTVGELLTAWRQTVSSYPYAASAYFFHVGTFLEKLGGSKFSGFEPKRDLVSGPRLPPPLKKPKAKR